MEELKFTKKAHGLLEEKTISKAVSTSVNDFLIQCACAFVVNIMSSLYYCLILFRWKCRAHKIRKMEGK